MIVVVLLLFKDDLGANNHLKPKVAFDDEVTEERIVEEDEKPYIASAEDNVIEPDFVGVPTEADYLARYENQVAYLLVQCDSDKTVHSRNNGDLFEAKFYIHTASMSTLLWQASGVVI